MKYFNESEFSNFEMMDQKLLSMLDEMRALYGHPIKITSTDIRELIKNDEDVSDLLNKEVYDFIKNKNLYRKTW